MEKINVGKLPLENNSNETVLAILFLQSKINEIIDWVNKYEFHIIDSMVDPVVNENHLKTLEDKVEKLDKDNTLFANAVLKRFQEIEARVKFIMENGKGLKEVSYTANHQTTKMFQDCKLQDLWDEQKSLEKLDKDIFDKPTDKQEKIEEIIKEFREKYPKYKFIVNGDECFGGINMADDEEFESWLRDKLKDICK